MLHFNAEQRSLIIFLVFNLEQWPWADRIKHFLSDHNVAFTSHAARGEEVFHVIKSYCVLQKGCA